MIQNEGRDISKDHLDDRATSTSCAVSSRHDAISPACSASTYRATYARCEYRSMLKHAPEHPLVIAATSGRLSGLHPIRLAEGHIMGVLGGPRRSRDFIPEL